MWAGVTRGFAGRKLSGSIKIKGFIKTRLVKIKIAIIPLVKSFTEK